MQLFTSSNPRRVYLRLDAEETKSWKAEEAAPGEFRARVTEAAREFAHRIAAVKGRRIDQAIIESPTTTLITIMIGRPLKPKRAAAPEAVR